MMTPEQKQKIREALINGMMIKHRCDCSRCAADHRRFAEALEILDGIGESR